VVTRSQQLGLILLLGVLALSIFCRR